MKKTIIFFLMSVVFLFTISCGKRKLSCSNTVLYDKRCGMLRDDPKVTDWQAQCDALPPPSCDDIFFEEGKKSGSLVICDTFLPHPKNFDLLWYEKECKAEK